MKLDFLYGTAWKEDQTSDCVFRALKVGYRAIDTANQRKHYNEPGVGEGLLKAYEELGIAREDIFLQTKYTYAIGQDHRKPYNEKDPYAKQVRSSLESSLCHLHTNYIDSLVLHGPIAFDGADITEVDKKVWREMETLHKEGLVKNIGVSNMTLGQLQQTYEFANIKPRFAQIRTFASDRWCKGHRDYCKEKDIIFQGFSLLTANRQFIGGEMKEVAGQKVPKLVFKGHNSRSNTFEKIVSDLGKSPAQIIFKFCQQIGILPIVGTRTDQNMKMNLELSDFELSDLQIEQIENIAF